MVTAGRWNCADEVVVPACSRRCGLAGTRSREADVVAFRYLDLDLKLGPRVQRSTLDFAGRHPPLDEELYMQQEHDIE